VTLVIEAAPRCVAVDKLEENRNSSYGSQWEMEIMKAMANQHALNRAGLAGDS
jgi:hypothetical protein